MHRYFLLPIIVAPFILFALTPDENNIETNTSPPQSFMENVKVENRRNGICLWTLSTERTVFSTNGQIADMENVRVEFPSDEMAVIADSGIYDSRENLLFLSGNIQAKTDDYTIKTDKVVLHSEREEIFTDEAVYIEGNGFRIEGKGLSSANNIVRLLNDVKAEFF